MKNISHYTWLCSYCNLNTFSFVICISFTAALLENPGLCIILSALSCIKLMRLISFLLWNIYLTGHCES